MRVDRFARVALGLTILSAFAVPALAGVYRGPGHYVVVSSSYVVSDRLESYYGAIEGPFPTAATCETRVTELKAIQKTRNVLDGSALFMCYELDAPMDGDSGIWWNPQRNE